VTSYADQQRVTELIKYGMIIVASIPLIILYPFLQRYFVKGMMIGAIKG
jgi:putative aldouronate transport system permease protein